MNKDTEKRWKIIRIYALMSVIAVAVNLIYTQFSYGISSDSMAWMFLYPLLGGCLFFLLLGVLIPGVFQSEYYRTFFNLHNFGIATLTVNSFLTGILEIAGTASTYTRMIAIAGWTLITVGLIILAISITETRMKIRQGDGRKK